MDRRILVILAVLAVVLAVVAVSIEAQRGGGRGGGGGGSGGGGAAPTPDDNGGNVDNGGNYDNGGNVDNGGNIGNGGNFDGNYDLPPGNYDAIEVSVSTDKSIYTEGEPIEIGVTAYNPTDSTITLEFGTSSRDSLGCQVYYTIDGISPEWSACNAGSDEIPIPPGGSYSWRPFTHTESVFPVTAGTHGVVGIVQEGYGPRYGQSDPITIWVVE